MSPQIWWYLARASGLVSWVLLVASLVLGVLLSTRVMRGIDRPAWLLAMHRWTAGLGVTFLGLHLAGLVADSYLTFSWAEILVPGTSSWRPLAVSLGVVAMWLVVAVEGTSLMMKRLPRRTWKAIHYGSYAMVWLVSVHAGLAGTDVRNRLYQAAAMLMLMVAATAAVIRVIVPPARKAASRA